MILRHENAEKRYTELRQAILKIVARNYPASLGLDFRLVDNSALVASEEWTRSARLVDWNWLRGYPSFQFKHPKRFELALWHRGKLVSLSLGRPTSKCAGLRRDFIEASPPPREVKVVPIVLITMTAYAEALGADEIRLVEPINDEVKGYYETLGLTYVHKGNFLFKKIG